MVPRKAKQLKNTNVYINKFLTAKGSNIARVARRLRKEMNISATWTQNGKVFIRTLGSPETAKTQVLGDENDRVRFDAV